MPAPSFLDFEVCSRVVDENGIMLDRMDDAFGNTLLWYDFCIKPPRLPRMTVAATEAPAPDQVDLAPTLHPITEIGNGEFTVRWDAPAKVEHFNATLTPPVRGFEDQIEIGGGDRSFTVRGRWVMCPISSHSRAAYGASLAQRAPSGGELTSRFP